MSKIEVSKSSTRTLSPSVNLYQKRLFCITAGFILVLLALRQFASTPVNQYALAAIVICYAAVASYKYLVYFIAFIIPVSTGMNTIIYLPLFILLILKCPRLNICQLIFPAIFIFMEFVLSYFSGYTFQFNKYLIYIGMFGTMVFLVFDITNNIDYGVALKMFCISTAFLLVCILINYLMSSTFDMVTNRMGEVTPEEVTPSGGDAFRKFSLNANAIGYFSASAYACMLIGRQKLHLSLLNYAIVMATILIPGAFSISRTWILISVLITIIYILRGASIKSLIMLLCLGAVMIYYLDYYAPNVMEAFEMRITNADVSGGGGRDEIFVFYNNFLKQNPEYLFTGLGVGNFMDITHAPINMHNAIQQIYVCYGLWGATLFLCMGWLFYMMFVRRHNISFIYFLPIVTAILFIQTIQFLTPHYCMLPVIIGCMAVKYGSQN